MVIQDCIGFALPNAVIDLKSFARPLITCSAPIKYKTIIMCSLPSLAPWDLWYDLIDRRSYFYLRFRTFNLLAPYSFGPVIRMLKNIDT